MNQAAAASPDKPDPDQTQPANLAKLKRYFTEARDITSDARAQSMIDADYYDSKQWTPAEKEALAKRHQPDIVINRIKPAINGIVGVVERGKSDPRAWPRTPNDEDGADVATDVLRYICDYNRWTKTKADCFLDMLVPGTMAALVGVDGDKQVTVDQVRWEEFFYDPRSRRRDYKDARYLGVAKWMYADDVGTMYPEKADAISSSVENGVPGLGPDLSFQDRPNATPTTWIDKRTRRLMVVELYYREGGTWMRCVFTGSDILDEGPSPYLDHKKKPHCPIEAQSAYVTQQNERYGAARDMRGPQDEINKRRSKLLHLLSVSQIEVADPQAIDVAADVARAEAARPDGVIPFGWRRVPTSDMAMGQAQLLAEAKSEIERMGPNPAVLGRDANDSSGRALLARQQAGLVELANLYAQLDDWELRVLRQCWARAKQYWTAPMWIRVTDDEDAPKFVGINMPRGEPLLHPPTTDDGEPHPQALQPMIDAKSGQQAEGQPLYHPPTDETGQPHPKAGQPVLGYKNQLGEMDVDITVDTVQETGTVAQEQFSDLMQMIGTNPMWAQQVPLDVLIQLSSIPHKRQLRDTIKAAAAKVASAQAQAQQLTDAKTAADIKERTSKAELNTAQAQAVPVSAAARLHDAHAAPMLHGLEAGMAGSEPLPPPPGGPSGQTGAPGFSPAS